MLDMLFKNWLENYYLKARDFYCIQYAEIHIKQAYKDGFERGYLTGKDS